MHVETPKKFDLAFFTRQKINSAIRQIAELQTSDFPHRDGKDALQLIRGVFEQDLGLIDRIHIESARDTNEAAAAGVNPNLYRFLPILGFILRSTNVRNAFEVFDPFLRLAKLAIGKDAKLVLSAEWDYSPLTYPLTFQELPNFVFLGLPTTECSNALIIPLAGHELGHSVWSRQGMARELMPQFRDGILAVYKDKPMGGSQLER